MNKIQTINRAAATLTNLVAILRSTKDEQTKTSALSHHLMLLTAFILYLDSMSINYMSKDAVNNIIDDAKIFIKETREKSDGRK